MYVKEFEDWKLLQEINEKDWKIKWSNHFSSARKSGVLNLLTFDEYLYKAFEAKLISPDQIGRANDQYNLSRINDEGNYTIESCRFISTVENQSEKDKSYLKHNQFSVGGLSGEKHWCHKLNEPQAVEIFLDTTTNRNDLASKFNISVVTVAQIQNRRTWKHVTEHLTKGNYNDAISC